MTDSTRERMFDVKVVQNSVSLVSMMSSTELLIISLRASMSEVLVIMFLSVQ